VDNEIGVRDLQQHASAVLRRVKSGESLIVTERGIPVASITPFLASSLDDMIRAGLAIAPREDLASVLAELPSGPIGTAGSDALEAMRGDDRL
jgi:prevent-host-death family protein